MLNIAVCDDDLVFATKMESMLMKLLEGRKNDVSIEVYADGKELWKGLEEGNRFQLLYLDIEMEDLDGIRVAKKIREDDTDAVIIFVSNYENRCMELFEAEPFRFIKKPVDETLFADYFRKAYDRITRSRDAYFEYSYNKGHYKVRTDSIMYFESRARAVFIVTKDGKRKFYDTLNSVEKKLESRGASFLRIHQSFLVNYSFIKEITYAKVVLFNGTEFRISGERRNAVREKVSRLIEREFLDG